MAGRLPTDENKTPLYGYDLEDGYVKHVNLVWDPLAFAYKKEEQAVLQVDNLSLNFDTPLPISGDLDPLAKYKICNGPQVDDGITYFGFADAEGNWYILQNDPSANTYLYAKGASDYAGNWAGRTGLSYGLYPNIF